ncbi:MAG: phosphohistidine phosphatase SixA [Cyanobacteria bacterium]|nr:phosphohistidine phosphatase SixA [Cyanobacteriota bacterium]
MELYLIRHGIAAERGTYANDADRPLTTTGIKRTQQVAQRLVELLGRFDYLLTSPLVRAQQTADILRRQGLCDRVEQVDWLSPDGAFDQGLAWLAAWLETTQTPDADSPQRIAFVGHQPDLGYWAERLVWGQTKGAIVLKKAGIVGILLPDLTQKPIRQLSGNGQLIWLTSPKLLL